MPEELQGSSQRVQQEEGANRTPFTAPLTAQDFDMISLSKQGSKENYEFLSALKAYFDAHYNGEFYDAVGRRRECKGVTSALRWSRVTHRSE